MRQKTFAKLEDLLAARLPYLPRSSKILNLRSNCVLIVRAGSLLTTSEMPSSTASQKNMSDPFRSMLCRCQHPKYFTSAHS
jgi:hypothetical protein